MGEFTLDTSGAVAGDTADGWRSWVWSELTPFAQGHVDAAAREAISLGYDITEVAFAKWSPSTLAAILRDCEQCSFFSHTEEGGRFFWAKRQAGRRGGFSDRFPPLTPRLGDDGLVYLECRENVG